MGHAAFQYILIAIPQVFTKSVCQSPIYDRPHRMDHIIAGKIITLCQGSRSCRLLVSVSIPHPPSFHNTAAFFPELHAGSAVNGIINTPVTGYKASQKLRIGGIDDSSRFQPRNIPLPDGYSAGQRVRTSILFLDSRNFRQGYHAFLFQFFLQICVLRLQHFLRNLPWHTDIHQRANFHFSSHSPPF